MKLIAAVIALLLFAALVYAAAYGYVGFVAWRRGKKSAQLRYGAPLALEQSSAAWYRVADDSTEILRDLLREDERNVPFLRLDDRERAEAIVSRFNDMRGSR